MKHNQKKTQPTIAFHGKIIRGNPMLGMCKVYNRKKWLNKNKKILVGKRFCKTFNPFASLSKEDVSSVFADMIKQPDLFWGI